MSLVVMIGTALNLLSQLVAVLRWPMVVLALACGASFVSPSLWPLARGVSLHVVIVAGIAAQLLATLGMIGHLRARAPLWLGCGCAAAAFWAIAFVMLLQLGQDIASPAAGMFLALAVFPFLIIGTGLQWVAAVGFLVDRA